MTKSYLFSLLLALPLCAAEVPSIKVTGVAEERVPADQLSMSCEIRSAGKDLPTVATTHRSLAADITKILRELGLGEAELKTGTASFGEDIEHQNGERTKLVLKRPPPSVSRLPIPAGARSY
jgi:uncharacterized protein YggE